MQDSQLQILIYELVIVDEEETILNVSKESYEWYSWFLRD